MDRKLSSELPHTRTSRISTAILTQLEKSKHPTLKQALRNGLTPQARRPKPDKGI